MLLEPLANDLPPAPRPSRRRKSAGAQMIMPKGQQLLLPVNPVFIVASLVLALALNLLPLGRVVWTPDWVMVLLVFWAYTSRSASVWVWPLPWACASISPSRPCWVSMRWCTAA